MFMNQFYRTIPTNRGRRAEVVAPYRVGLPDIVRENRYTDITGKHGGICGTGPAIRPPSFGGKSGDAGRAAADAYSKSKDGRTLSGYLYPCENRRRVRSCAVNFRTGLPKQRRNLGFLGGANKGCAPLRGAKARLSGHLSSLLLTFGLCQKSVAPGGRNPRPKRGKEPSQCPSSKTS